MIETERLILREIDSRDREDLLEMDSDPEVRKFIDQQVVHDISEVDDYIQSIKSQYQQFGTGRWAVIDKASSECLGWCGIKFIDYPINNLMNFYELGYRFKRKHWGKGLAFEASQAILAYNDVKFNPKHFYAITHIENTGSRKVLEKLGFHLNSIFEDEGIPTTWYIR